MRYLRSSAVFAVLVGASITQPALQAQGLSVPETDRGPRFLLARESDMVSVDIGRTPVLTRRLSLSLEGATIKEALAEISRQSGLRLVYSDDIVPMDQPVHLQAEAITTAAALTDVLLDAAVDVVFRSDGGAALVPRTLMRMPLQAQGGGVAGRLSDGRTAQGLGGGTVYLEGSRWRTVSGEDGRYRLTGVPPGRYTIVARRLGYGRQSRVIEVAAETETTLDLVLEPAPTQLEEVVVTGSVVPAEVKALPAPISVAREAEIAAQRPRTVQQLVRGFVPNAVTWDYPNTPYITSFSVRGASSLSSGTGQMKVLVDGLEAANPSVTSIDPNSIDRVEVVRGPQAAGLYGPDAIGGVIQIFTKRGDPGLARPRIDADASAGVLQTPYPGFAGVLRQQYAVSVRGGTGDVGYSIGTGYSRTGDYLPNGEQSAQSAASAYTGVRYARGVLSADVSARYLVQDVNPQVFNPDLTQTGFFYYSKPVYQPAEVVNRGVGTRVGVTATGWWDNTLQLGFDEANLESMQSQPRLTTPADTLLLYFDQARSKSSAGYTASLHPRMPGVLSGSLVVGVDYYRLTIKGIVTTGALNQVGTIGLAPGRPVQVARTLTENAGAFTQLQFGVRDAVFLTGGLRADWNTDFGSDLGTPVSPRLGLSLVRPVAAATVKLRGSYGRAIRAPDPARKLAFASATTVILPNAELGPERQQGWDAGFDAVYGRASVSLTYFDQTAEGLIQRVLVAATPPPTFQYQNVGRVKNTGVEIEGTFGMGRLELKGQYANTRSRVVALPANYTGELLVGEAPLLTPTDNAGVTGSLRLLTSTVIAAGVTYVGSWSYYDQVAQARCSGGTGPCAASLRGYVIQYPGIVKGNATVSQQITPRISGYVSVDNLTNNHAFEAYNSIPVTGRITMVGLQVHQ